VGHSSSTGSTSPALVEGTSRGTLLMQTEILEVPGKMRGKPWCDGEISL
jgi:hypothetical protein